MMMWLRLLSAPPKAALTVWFVFSVTTQVSTPLQPLPFHPAKLNPLVGVAMSVTWVPMAKLAVQLDGQLIPLGLLVTVPVPAPEVVTVRTAEVPALKVAVTEMAPFIVTWQLPAPAHPPPLQPENSDPDPADAVSVTTVLLAKLALQVPGQLIPVGLLVTFPDPLMVT